MLNILLPYLHQKYKPQVKVKTPGTDASRFPQKINKTERKRERNM